MDACDSETVLQIIVGTRQPFDVITLKDPCSEVVGDVAKMLKRLRKRPQRSKIIPHPCQMSQILFLDLLTAVLRLVSQDGFGLIQKAVGARKLRPELCCRL